MVQPRLSVQRRHTRRHASAAVIDRELATRSESELIAQVLSGNEPAGEVVQCGAQLARIPFWQRRMLGARGLVSEYSVPLGRAVRLAALWELAARWYPDDRPSVSSPREALLLLEPIRLARREQVMVVLLDSRQRPLSTEVVAVGTLNVARLSPRDVIAPALKLDASAIVVGHNHPSGDTRPSNADRSVTEALRSAGSVMGIPIMDHVIVARNGYYSFREAEGWDIPAVA